MDGWQTPAADEIRHQRRRAVALLGRQRERDGVTYCEGPGVALDCKHGICTESLEKIVRVGSSARYGETSTVECPSCRTKTRLSQQFFVDFSAQYSVHAQVQPRTGRKKLSDIKLMKEDPAGVEKMTDEIKTRYARLFRV